LEIQSTRLALADMIKQFLLIVISLGLTNAFAILASPPGADDAVGKVIVRIFQQCTPSSSNSSHCANISLGNLFICVIYIMICTRFLLSHWLFLSNVYARQASTGPRRHIRIEAFGVFLTGILLGMQSSYAAVNTLYDFVALFAIILLIDSFVSFLSVVTFPTSLSLNDKLETVYWTVNNVFFCFLCGLVLWYIGRSREPDLKSFFYWLLIALVLANCAISLCITLYNYLSGGSGKLAPLRRKIDPILARIFRLTERAV
jgi:hypothetical protein